MDSQQVNLELMNFVETQILPQYAHFGASHGISHAQRVIANSLKLAQSLGADVNMAYAIAAYHDLGMSGPRAIHHITGGKILQSDRRLRRWFSEEQVKVMKQAIEDHRASSSHAPRSLYGKIVAEADRDLDPDTVFRRTIHFGKEQYPDKSMEEQWERFREHMLNKYSAQGYIHLWLPHSPNEGNLREIRRIISNPPELRERFERIFDEISAGN